MVKLVFTLHRKSGMSFEEFSRYWRNVHAPIGAALPGVRKYIQNHARATLDGSPLPHDGYSEMWFDDMESLQRAAHREHGEDFAALFPKVRALPRDVICEPYGFVPLLSGGVQFHHIRADYPFPLIFLCAGRKRVLETLRRAGFEVK
jgi:uncharacterized protein (TIGR02118 family)